MIKKFIRRKLNLLLKVVSACALVASLGALCLPGTASAAMGREEYARMYADVSLVIAEVGRAQLGWMDGQNPVGPANDPGRGVSRWFDHFSFAMDSQLQQTVPQLVLERLQTIQQSVPTSINAKLYADLSVLISIYGRRSQNWADGQDPNGPANDPGRGVSCLEAHFNYAAFGGTNWPLLVNNRLSALLQ